MARTAFFKSVRKSLFNGRMTALQVSGCERLWDAWDAYGYGLDTGLAYILAVSYHETGKRMQPVREGYGTSTADTIRRLDKAFSAGQLRWVKTPYWRKGWFGRGDVQLTHEANYNGKLRQAVQAEFGVDIHEDPDLVLRPDISAFILIEGVSKAVTLKSDFTAFSLEQYINETKTDYDNARKTVNPNEKDSYKTIGDYARKFETAIRAQREADGEPFRTKMTKPRGRMREEVATAEVVDVRADNSGDVVAVTETRVPEAVVAPVLPATVASKTGIYDGAYHAELEIIQKLMRDKGYYGAGNPDGKWGVMSGEAVLAVRRGLNLPLVDEIDDAFVVALVKAPHRQTQLSKARTEATVETIKDAPTVKVGLDLKNIGKWLAGGGLTGAIGSAGLSAADMKGHLDTVTVILGVIKPAMPYLLLAAAGYGVYYLARRVIQNHLEGYREGRHV